MAVALRAWSTLRKEANNRDHFVRRTFVDGAKTPVFVLFDDNLNVKLATRSQRAVEDAVYSL